MYSNFKEPTKRLFFQSGYTSDVTNAMPLGAIEGTQ